MDVQIKLSGLKEAQRALYAYSQQLGDRVVIASLRQGANLVARAVRAAAPRRTGRLRRGVVVKRSRIHNGRRSAASLGLYLTLRKGKGRKDPRDAFYGRFVEDGYTTRGGRAVPGRKFIKASFAARRDQAARLIVAAALAGAALVAKKTGLAP